MENEKTELKVSFVEAELTKISLKPGDVLMIKISGADRDLPASYFEPFRKSIEGLFHQNEVGLILVPENVNIKFEAITPEEPVGCGVKACDDCTCGKKEMLNGS